MSYVKYATSCMQSFCSFVLHNASGSMWQIIQTPRCSLQRRFSNCVQFGMRFWHHLLVWIGKFRLGSLILCQLWRLWHPSFLIKMCRYGHACMRGCRQGTVAIYLCLGF